MNLFSEYKHTLIMELSNGDAKETTLFIDQTKVLVCGEHSHGIFWSVFKNPIYVKLDKIKIPRFPLEANRDAYIKLRMLEKAQIIDEHLKQN
ncbi:hypothetical protein KAW80_02830 [Candidatus Babeliales bacterium]|nr:hypothetical protein [Candidatus Babeliales bacterium]